jgi:hypothetical protein
MLDELTNVCEKLQQALREPLVASFTVLSALLLGYSGAASSCAALSDCAAKRCLYRDRAAGSVAGTGAT